MSAARTERLLNLLTLLLNARRPISLRELRTHEEFRAYHTSDPKSGERAFERDKAALVELGVPLRWVPPEEEGDEDGIGGYMIDRRRYFLPPLDLTPAELALLSIAGAAAAAIEGFPGRITVVRALAKLGFDVDEAGVSASLAHAPILIGRDPARVGAHLQVLHDAVARRRRVQITYRAKGGETTARAVDPYGLFYRQGVWYLVGYCQLRQAERTFHLGRCEAVTVTHPDRHSPEFDVPESFDLSTYVQRRPWEMPGDPPCEAVVRVAERLVPAIPEMFGRRVDVEHESGGARVRLSVSNRAALIAAVMPFGAAAEVIEPADLRREIGAIYEQLAERYAAGTPEGSP
jgi:predicted DNA-binding transcriptional regulator YafY